VSLIRPVVEQTPRPLLLTGAAHGIGAAVARLAGARTPLALVDRDRDAVTALADELRTDERPTVGLVADVRDEAAVAAAFDDAIRDLGPLGGVVVSAGIDRGGLLHELDVAAWDEVVAINLRGAFLACRAALRAMLEHGGAIVCVSSPLGEVAVPGAGAYGASKAGIGALVRSAAVDYGAHGIRVNAVLPGPTETDLMWATVPKSERPAMRETIAGEVPLGRLADPSEPARAVLWLLSDEASYVTGAQLACDGGVLAKASVSV
jgi:NAD(P)-dependent dehydrogenase (short-subunit alcohol dehydrogenase family)